MPLFDVVVIGASAGGVSALGIVLGQLPMPIPVGIAVVLHLSPDHRSRLVEVLSRFTRLPVAWAEEGMPLLRGRITVAPPDHHLVFRSSDSYGLVQSPRVHYSRPSVDQLFESAAGMFGRRALAVILSGSGTDGADGVMAIHEAGGTVIAQDEASSEYFSMPHEAIESGGVTFVLPLAAIAGAVTQLVTFGIVPGPGGAARSA